MVNELEQRSLLRQQTELAIRLAREGRWEEAALVNRAIVDAFPEEVEAYNRLGKALLELGRYAEAREAYTRALELDPHNAIARRNLSRIHLLEAEGARATAGGPRARKLPPEMFIEETGKTCITTLARPNREAAARLSAGDEVFLRPEGGSLLVLGPDGETLGEVEPRLGQRLVRLMEGGNRYVAAMSSLTDTGDVRIFIREVFQHPSQAGRPSFPPQRSAETFRPYTKERLIRQDSYDELVLDEELMEEAEEEWAEEASRLGVLSASGLSGGDLGEEEGQEEEDLGAEEEEGP
ncbi:MAG TPA: tetratricopeptide repeat protein [Dehalococcoidia bacterium]|nr:tetratricopeptide repeat protein [Dehalococcoidia bacterium]